MLLEGILPALVTQEKGKLMAITRKLAIVTLLLAALVALAGCSRKSDTALIENGKQFMAKKDYLRAALQFRNAIRANPKNAEAQYQLALAQIGFGDKISAYRALTKALDLNPKHKDAQLTIANLLVTSSSADDIKLAQEHAQAVLDASPENPDALDAMALADLRLGKREEGMELLEQASSKAPDHLQTAAMLMSVRLAQKDTAGAEKVLKQAVEETPESLQGRLMLGSFYLLIGKNREGEQELRKVLEKEPNNPRALVGLATLLNSAGRKNEAEEMYRRLATGPSSPYQSAYASYLFRIGKQKESVAEFERLAKIDPKDVNARTRLVAAYVATKRLADAQGVLRAALDKNPKDTAALLQRAELHIMAGSYEDARQDLNQALHFTPDPAKAHFLLASIERAEGQPLKQRQELAETLRLNPRFFAARIALARVYIAEQQSRIALDLMDKTPDDQKTTLGFVEYNNWALLASGDLQGLRKGIDQGLAKTRTRDLLLQDALLKLRQMNDSSARASLLEILKRNPEDLDAVKVLIGSYASKKQLPAAIVEVRALLSRRPKSAPLQYQLGALLAATGQLKAARTAFTAIADDPRFLPSRMALAAMDRHEGKPEAARQVLDSLLASKATELPARLELGVVEAKVGNYAKAIEHFRKVVEAQPQNVIALNNLAYLLADTTNETDEALKYAQKAKELAPNDINVGGTIGWAYFRKGMYSFALQQLQEAVNREGKNVIDGTAIRRYHLAMAYKKAGDEDKAAKTLSAALKLDPNLPEARVATQMLADSK
jgi:tetratricopeptide (TPR) repeat protein